MIYEKRTNQWFEFLVSVIVIAVLALVAIPKMTQVAVYARITKLKTLRASVITASTLVHNAVLMHAGKADSRACIGSDKIADNSTEANGTLCITEGLLNLVYAYPAVTEFGQAGILSAAGLSKTFNPKPEQITANGYAYMKVSNLAIFQVTGGSDAFGCAFTYQEAGADSEPYISATLTAGC